MSYGHNKQPPKIPQLTMDPKRIGELIGPGGKVIKGIIEKTGVDIDVKDDGSIFISSIDDEKASEARSMIEGIVKEVKVGEIYAGKVTRTEDYGVFVEILPNKDGLVHVSELADEHIRSARDVVKVGDTFKVKVIGIDVRGRINLSKKALERGTEPDSGERRKPLGYRTPYYKRPGYKR